MSYFVGVSHEIGVWCLADLQLAGFSVQMLNVAPNPSIC